MGESSDMSVKDGSYKMKIVNRKNKNLLYGQTMSQFSLWGYQNQNGPHVWSKWFPIAKEGRRQSPINIDEDRCIQNANHIPLKLSYDPYASTTVENDGKCWRVATDPLLSCLSGGPLESNYQLIHYEGHWGKMTGEGSEHTINGEKFDAELQLVHRRSNYSSTILALNEPDGLAIVSILLKVGKPHPEFNKLCLILNHVQRKGLHKDINTLKISIENFLPKNKSYFSYSGSLTSPPLSECVKWLVFKESVEVSRQQIIIMRGLYQSKPEEEEEPIQNNCRPTQPLESRTIQIFES